MVDHLPSPSDDPLERRFPRRLLLGAGAVAAALGATEVFRAPDADAAPASTPWRLGGNADVTTDGTNWLGATTKSPIIFKNANNSGKALERMRIAVTGRIGIGTTTPAAQLDAVAATGVGGIRGTTDSVVGVQGVATTGTGVDGRSGYIAVYGSADSYGGVFYGNSASSYGVYASGTNYGLMASGAIGVSGTGSSRAVSGVGGSYGVWGSGSVGVYGTTSDPNQPAVLGSGGQYGVQGVAARTAGVRGDSDYVGTWGQGGQWGVYAVATATTGQTYGVQGVASSPSGFGVWCSGNMNCTGTLSKAAGSFRIDHPLDPDRQWLSHSFVESPDMMNVYNGNVVLGADGSATVDLPKYFAALNRDFRYQLTCLGGFAPVYVKDEVKDNRFTIAGGTAGLKVSWQVTGIRQDDYAKAHPIVVETPKAAEELGTRQFAAPGTNAVQFVLGPRATPSAPPASVVPPLPATRP